MNKPSWAVFRSKADQTTVFEKDVALRIFCNKAGIDPTLLTCPPNYAGIENVPVQSADGWVAFQAKHSLNGSQNGDAFDSLRKVIDSVRNGLLQLNKIYCFSSGVAPSTKTAQTTEQRRIVADLLEVGITVEWYYSDRILTILEDATDPNLLRASQAFFEDLPQPSLYQQKSTANPEGFRRLHFSEQLSEFTGRKTELQQLERFTNTDEKFCWWLVTGPGLSGKSRLLLEHCSTLKKKWHWGWLVSNLDDFNFSGWIPNQDTFIVVDYVLGREQKIINIFQQLEIASRSNRFVHKVRIILLERNYSAWLRTIEHAPSIGNWIAERKFMHDGLKLERISNVLAAIEGFPAGEFIDAIRELLQREEQRRWQVVSQVEREALVLATICGGFSLVDQAGSFRTETKSYLDQLNCSRSVAKMIGVEHSPNHYPSLEPDVFGELFALDEIQQANPSDRNQILQRAYELNAAGLVNFLYRCAQSFPEHTALRNAHSDWSYDEPSRFAYLAIFANGLESDSFSQALRLNTYREILSKLSAPSDNFFFLERVIFGKILALFPENNLEIRTAEIQMHASVHIATQPSSRKASNSDILSSLLPLDYCDAVSHAWRQLNDINKLTLLGPHLVEIFYHQIIRSLEVHPRHLEDAQALLNELVDGIVLSNGGRYVATIYSFQSLCANVIAALVQFGHRSPEAMDWADEIRRKADSLASFKREDRWMRLLSSNLDQIDFGLTTMVAFYGHRDYQYKLQRLEAIRQRDAGIQPNDPLKCLAYVQAAVSASSGFIGGDEAREARAVLERCREYTATVGTPEISEPFAMVLINLAGYATSFDLGQTSWDFFVEAAELGHQHPQPQHNLINLTLGKLHAYFENQVKSGDLEGARRSLKLARSMIESANTVHYDDAQRLYVGYFDSLLLRFVTGQPTFLEEAQEMARFLSTSPSVLWRQMMGNIGAGSKYFSEAQRGINGGDRPRAGRALQVLKFYMSIDPANSYSWAISYIEEHLKAPSSYARSAN